jgi:hypothetical protein
MGIELGKYLCAAPAPGLPTQTEKNPLKTPDFSQKIP